MSKKKKIIFYLLLFLVLYLGLIIKSSFYGKYLDKKLATFDVNNDSFFSSEEQTPEQQKYMDLWVSDVGRNLIPITGLIISFIVTLLVFVFLEMCAYIFRRTIK